MGRHCPALPSTCVAPRTCVQACRAPPCSAGSARCSLRPPTCSPVPWLILAVSPRCLLCQVDDDSYVHWDRLTHRLAMLSRCVRRCCCCCCCCCCRRRLVHVRMPCLPPTPPDSHRRPCRNGCSGGASRTLGATRSATLATSGASAAAPCPARAAPHALTHLIITRPPAPHPIPQVRQPGRVAQRALPALGARRGLRAQRRPCGGAGARWMFERLRGGQSGPLEW